jgi:hypothetical protein
MPDFDDTSISRAYVLDVDGLIAAYGDMAFVHSILTVFGSDCPRAMERLTTCINIGDIEGARRAAHSLANIVGIIGSDRCSPLIGAMSTALRDNDLCTARDRLVRLEQAIQSVLSAVSAQLAGMESGSN